MEIILIIIFFFIFYYFFIYRRKYNETDHVVYDSNTKLSRDAKIVNFDSKVVGLKGEKTFEVIVEFDDGFKYIAHGAHIENVNMFSSILTLTEEMKINIIQNANEKHKEAIEKQERNGL